MTAIAVEKIPQTRATRAPIPRGRLISVELQKMFDTRSGFWLMASILITSLLATSAVILWAPDAELTYSTFATAIGFPMAIILPMIAILSVTSEWSQRSGLTTFTLVPHRSRVITAKAISAVLIAVVSMLLAFAVGAIGNIVGTALTGTNQIWDVSTADVAYIIVGNVIGLMVGFMLGVLLRNSAGAIVTYFVYSLVLPTIAEVLAASQGWFSDIRGWVDFNYAQVPLFDASGMTGENWAQLAVTGAVWLGIPLMIGWRMVLHSEVK